MAAASISSPRLAGGTMCMHPSDLFAAARPGIRHECLAPGAFLLHGFAWDAGSALLAAIEQVLAIAPLRNMQTPGGRRMSVAMSNCGTLGWISDRRGYRYSPCDPLREAPWPAMPEAVMELAVCAATAAGFAAFAPDACLVNCYRPGTRLALHQDRDEADFDAPIVSVSLGLPATFLLGGDARGDKPLRIPLQHGDVVVWGGPARLRHHGVLPLKAGNHELLGERRINLTLRRAGKPVA
jgi:alkylated DNA repair protein (DNA oxidative demethylase)